ncbi:hypothetical protein [Nocardioides pakistanensis]
MADPHDRRDDSEPGRRPQQQQEPVHAPYRGGEAPTRSPSTVIWVTVAIAAVLALGVALVVAAIVSA